MDEVCIQKVLSLEESVGALAKATCELMTLTGVPWDNGVDELSAEASSTRLLDSLRGVNYNICEVRRQILRLTEYVATIHCVVGVGAK
jgi:hypothetical protein